MDVTWVEVADTAVKVGLGAAIGAFGAYFTTRASHRHEIQRDRITRRRELLERIALEFEEQSVLTAKVMDLYSSQIPGPGHPAITHEIRRSTTEASNHMLRAFQFAALVGEREISEALSTYQQALHAFGRITYDGSQRGFPVELRKAFEDTLKLLGEGRQEAGTALSNAYGRVEKT